ncbi:MAG: c-type cytochrome, partial [Gammaproteobacteria bacterium]|nr:c-type cytochrome [Gammaproteobacteria bacterium]
MVGCLVGARHQGPALAASTVADHGARRRGCRATRATATARAEEGYALFRQHCLPCHSLNKEGGLIGPELNVPRNVTEYRSEQQLREWIRSAQSFRWRTKMPDYTWLEPQQIVAIVDYLS